MSDELPPGSVNLEDDGPPIAPVTPPPVAAAPAAEPVAPPAPVGDIEETLQPADLVDAGKAQGLIGAVKGLRGEKTALKGENDQLRQQLQQQAQMLQTFQALQQQLKPVAPAGPPPADPQAEAFARKLDYLNADGTPNLQRGAEIAQLIRDEAAKITQQQMQPLADRQNQARSAELFQWAATTTAQNGLKPSPETLTQLWQTLPVEYTANPQVAQTLWVTAIGMDAAGGKKPALPTAPAPPLSAPLLSEPVGGAPRVTKPLTAAEQNVIANRGMTEAKYREHTKDYVKGRASVLEDD